MRAAWQKHPNIGGPASMLLMIHDQFRTASERLLFAAERERDFGWLARAFAPLAETLHHHHHAEERMLFPMMKERTGAAPEDLVDDHRTLTSAITVVEESFAGANRADVVAAIVTFRDVLVAHLDREEARVVPVLLEMTPEEAWARVERG